MKPTSKHLLAACLASTLVVALPARSEPGEAPSGGVHAGRLRDLVMQKIGNAREREKSARKGYAEIVLEHANALKLSDEQLGKVTRIHQDSQQTIEALTKKVRQTMKATHQTFLDPAADEAAIRRAAKEHVGAFDELVDTALKSRNAINAVLAPEQRAKLKTLQAEP